MHKVTKTAVFSLLLAGIFGILTACDGGKATAWADMIYPDYDTLYVDEVAPEGTEGYWDYWETKPIKYQFTSDHSNPKATDDHSFASYFSLLMNLYEDGSVKAWQYCSLSGSMFYPMEGSTGTAEQNEYNSTYKLLVLYYGYWEGDETNVTLYVQNSVDYGSDGANIQYTEYEFSLMPDSDNLASFYFNQTENGVAIRSYISCNFNYVGTVKHKSYANFALTKAWGSTTEPDGELVGA